MIRIVKIAVLALGPVLGGSCLAQADAYPSKPVRFIVAFPPGNATDILARLFADKLSQTMKQSVFVENKPGAAGIIGTELVAKATPDGYTVLIGQSGALAVNPYLYKLSFDPQKDLAPVTLLITGHTVLVVGQDSPYKSVKELIVAGREQPGKLTYASYGAGHIAHLMGEMFKSAAGVDILHVPYKSGPIPDVIAGRVDMIFDSTAVVVPHIKSGRLDPLPSWAPSAAPACPRCRASPRSCQDSMRPAGSVSWYRPERQRTSSKNSTRSSSPRLRRLTCARGSRACCSSRPAAAPRSSGLTSRRSRNAGAR
jgi:tripartite-type tricarboxylate transporter receptor subunit TctC